MTSLLLTLLVSFVPQLYGAGMTSTQRVSFLVDTFVSPDTDDEMLDSADLVALLESVPP